MGNTNRQKHIAEMSIKLCVALVVLTGHFKNILGSVQKRNLHIHGPVASSHDA